MEKTNRVYTDVETGKIWNLHFDSQKNSYHLIYENKGDQMDHATGSEVNGFYATVNEIDLKINSKKIIKLPACSFYNLKENEHVTHKRYTGIQKNFSKI